MFTESTYLSNLFTVQNRITNFMIFVRPFKQFADQNKNNFYSNLCGRINSLVAKLFHDTSNHCTNRILDRS